MLSVDNINEMQKTIERKDRIIKVLKERVKQWVKEYNLLDEFINIKDQIIDMYQQLYQDEHCYNLQLRETLRQINETILDVNACTEDKYKRIFDLIDKAEEE